MCTVTSELHLIRTAQKRAEDLSRTASKLSGYLTLRAGALLQADEQGWRHEGETDGRILAQIDALQLQLQDVRNLLVRSEP